MRIPFLILMCGWLSISFGQQFETYLVPGLGYRSVTLNKNLPDSYKDSLANMDHLRQNWSGGVSYIHQFNENSGLQIGLMYRRVSFKRKLEDIQFHDTVHPSIGRIEDLSQSFQKDAHFTHLYQYLSIPVTYQQFLAPKYGRSKYSVYLTLGASADFLIDSQTDVFLRGFSVKGKSRYNLPADYAGNGFNVSAMIGAKYTVKISEKAWFNLQPHLMYQVLNSASDNDLSLRLFQLNLQAGVAFEI
ncbi:MAG: hypothetical protein H6608_04225 [Flavobacteriales bacterium]|nr:hypothetical protein [Bacteroidota bacterium]MCB9240308.1 hypothetical protein [Flavobacteriales bacterium]